MASKKLEKRTTTRINNQDTLVQLAFNDKIEQGQIIDISEEGVRVLLDKNVHTLPTTLHLTTTADDASVKLENLPTKLISKCQQGDDKTLIGLCWEKLSGHSRKNIHGYLRGVLQA